MTVGLREVAEKRRRWLEQDPEKRLSYLSCHMVPVILGPKKRSYVIDHHHLARALHDEGIESIFVAVVADLHQLEEQAFWTVLDCRSWTHPYDARGKRRSYADLPKSIDALIDDPYRSMAGELRRAGGFAKDEAPFAEFLWADFLRPRIKRKEVEKNFSLAMESAMTFAKSRDASYLPGWSGPDPE
jgi:hypothetical protein